MTTTNAVEGYWEVAAEDVPGIEKALARLRKDYASAQAVQEGHAGTRNSVANLVVYAGSDEDAAPATATLLELAERHPARTIMLIADLMPGEPSVDACVSATCRLGYSGRRVCYEEIRLHAGGRSGPHLRSIIEPLLISDLPVFLWWTGDPPLREPVFGLLAGMSSRVLVDSARFRTPAATLSRLAYLMRDGRAGAAVGDLNWNRVEPWRQLIAQLCDPDAMIELLPSVRRLAIEVATSGSVSHPVSGEALLLAGWLADRLDWQSDRPAERTFAGSYRLRLRGHGHEVVVELRSSHRERAAPGTVEAVQIEADDGAHRAVVSITHAFNEEHAYTSVRMDGAPPTERALRFLGESDAELLSHEIETLDRDETFEGAVEAAARLGALLPEHAQ